MRKKVFSGVLFALVILLIAGYGMNRSMNSYADLSDLAMANVEALANNEITPNVITCYSTYRITPVDSDVYVPLWIITECNGCSPVSCFELLDSNRCTKSGGILV